VVLNGRLSAAPVELRAGVPHRFRLINITLGRPSINVFVLRDTSLVQWRALAKDGLQQILKKNLDAIVVAAGE